MMPKTTLAGTVTVRRQELHNLVEATRALSDVVRRVAEIPWPDVVRALANARDQMRVAVDAINRSIPNKPSRRVQKWRRGLPKSPWSS